MKTAALVFRDAGIDWITCTARHEEQGKRLAILADEIMCRVRSEGNLVKPWAWREYMGFSSEGIRSGARHDDVIVQLSSETAKAHWSSVAKLASNISRLDVQTTARLVPFDAGYGKVVYRDAVKFKRKHQPNLTVGMMLQHQKGMTTMIGSRQSDRYLRCYDKFQESKDKAYQDCWRYEVEYKGDRAKTVATNLLAEPETVEIQMSLVLSEFSNRGHRPPLPFVQASLSESHRKTTTIDRRLEWAEKQWSTLIQDSREVGRLSELLSRVGLTVADARAFIESETIC